MKLTGLTLAGLLLEAIAVGLFVWGIAGDLPVVVVPGLVGMAIAVTLIVTGVVRQTRASSARDDRYRPPVGTAEAERFRTPPRAD
ncbi:hypothetical protein [Microbacterium sp. gxy059]|uniref:hypothetical protein n=1 Tax=Microbacterium sp. gxy059 TaxID=2957199 RepID=UPI003D9948E7